MQDSKKFVKLYNSLRSFSFHETFSVQSNFVLIFCVEFWELSHLTCDLSQAEKKINVVTHKLNKTISLKMKVEVVILSGNSCQLVSCSACNNSDFLLSLSLVTC